MKVPKRIIEMLNRKQDFIDARRDKLSGDIVKLQSQLLNRLLAEVIPSLDVKDGMIQDTDKNYRLISGLDKVYNQFTATSGYAVTSDVVSATTEIAALNRTYFEMVTNKDMTARLAKVLEKTSEKMNIRLGINKGKSVSGGFIDSLIKDKTLSTDIKNFVSKSVTGQIDQKQFIKGLTDLISGVPKEAVRDGQSVIIQTGGLEKQYQRYGYDLYQQYDRAYSVSVADEFEMKYFLYQGGLIDDSRDFCVSHNNRVWSREEAADWDTWKPYQGTYPEGYTIKAKDIYTTPSYLGYAGYQPLIDFGGYRCRHSIGFISDELAMELRKDLQGGDKTGSKEPELKEPIQPKTEQIEAKTREDAEKKFSDIFKKNTNFDVRKIDIDPKLSLDDINLRNRTLSELFNNYKISDVWKTDAEGVVIKYRSGINYGDITHYRAGERLDQINFGSRSFSGRAEAVEINKFRAKSKVDFENVSKATQTHEFAHLISIKEHSMLTESKFWSEIKAENKIYRTELKKAYNTGDKALTQELYLGDYAQTNLSEFMAEAFTEYRLSSQPSKYALRVGRIIDKYYKK